MQRNDSNKTKPLDIRRGKLKIDPNDKIIRGKVGFVASLRQDINHVLTITPKKPIIEYAGIKDHFPTLLKKSKMSPILSLFNKNKKDTGNMASTIRFQSESNANDKDIISTKSIDLKENQLVLVQPICTPDTHVTLTSTNDDDFDPHYLKIYTYETKGDKQEDMPESGYAIKITGDGIVPANLVKLSEDNFVPFTGDIFPHLPQINDIAQGTFGDCFLLSTIIAMLNANVKINEDVTYAGADYFVGIMRQVSDTHTIVRLFPENTSQPVNIKVENSIYVNEKLGTAVHHKAIWPHLIEKAYTALGIMHDEKNQGKVIYVNTSFRSVYGEGGMPDVAMKILTGKDAKRINLVNGEVNENNVLPWCADANHVCINICIVSEEIEKLKLDLATANPNAKSAETLKRYQNQLSDSLKMLAAINNPFSLEQALKWGNLMLDLSTNKQEIYYEFKKIMYPPSRHVTYTEACNMLNTFNLFVLKNKLALPDDIIETFKKFISNENISSNNSSYYRLPGDFGTGIYNQEQMDIYSQIESTLKKGNLAVASTPDKFEESDVRGLRASHAYAVIGVTEREVKGNKLKFIKLVNPWGKIVRDYNWDNETGIELQKNMQSYTSGGEFELELNEFQKYFSKLSMGEFINMEPKPSVTPDVSSKNPNPRTF